MRIAFCLHSSSTASGLYQAGSLHAAGVNNAYLVNVRHELALVYNDASVLENRHLAAMYGLLAGGAKADVLAAVDPARWRELRKLIINAVIHTDMVHHFPMVSKARTHTHGLVSKSVDTAKLAICREQTSSTVWIWRSSRAPRSASAMCAARCMPRC